ncbi:transcriptional regulator, LysR family [Saccharopolyspora kobensis]|uniref:Transcriptional regulator, LysR family n=1 Tax=Saccharopolyspora kobensis TaxID=146035 RepID=A0A1H5T640_9PSEU|nr:LysR substrate-binding domain-containing protein [Saccharopolyspora kobensis]SEF57467.1 transcriptional regulator, LysR family [Saccharopolyspora kobensis]SFC50658.1 transcriptional regulator, LysR family [Saccharopolyspora kobensis]
MFTLNQLTGFVAVAEEQHFGRAAQRLRMTQPPLTRQIQQLEKELKVQLFDRTSRTVRLTPAGRAFLQDARRLLHEAENAALSVRRVTLGRAGIVRIGFTATSAYGVLGGLLATVREHLPHVDVVLHELVTRDQAERLSGGSLDLGLARPPAARPELASRLFRSEPLLAALPEGHPLAGSSEPLELGEFHGADVVMYSPTEARYFHELLVTAFGRAGVQPTYVQHVSQIHTALALVQVGLGSALVPATAARLRFEGVRFRPLRLPEPDPVELHLVWRRANDNPALHALLDLL